MTALLGAVCGIAVTGGLLTIVIALLPATPSGALPGSGPVWQRILQQLRLGFAGSPGRRDPTIASGWGLWRWPTALGTGLVAWLASGWPVAGLIVAVGVVGLPLLVTTGRASTRGIDRAQAVEEWTRRLCDVLVVGVGLEQAIAATLATCPDPLRVPVADLAARLDARWPTESALRAFADDLDDPVADLVAATLILSARRRGPGLAKVLTAVADSLAEEVAMRRKVDAERAKPRATARAVTAITLAVTAAGALNTSYLTPYATPLGQLVLAVLVAGYVGALAWMHTLTRGAPAPRLFTPITGRGRSGRQGQPS